MVPLTSESEQVQPISTIKLDSRQFLAQVEEISGERIFACYQCGNCSAGCPVAADMPALPHQIVRFVQVGSAMEAVANRTAWFCASCGTCASRCPKGLDLSRVMASIRAIVQRNGKMDLQKDNNPKPVNDLPQQAFIASWRKLEG